MRMVYGIFLIAVVVFGLSFAVENAHLVRFNYYVGSREVALAWMLVLTVLAGAVLGILASLGVILRLRGEVRRLRKRVATAQQEVQNLRAIPIRDGL